MDTFHIETEITDIGEYIQEFIWQIYQETGIQTKANFMFLDYYAPLITKAWLVLKRAPGIDDNTFYTRYANQNKNPTAFSQACVFGGVVGTFFQHYPVFWATIEADPMFQAALIIAGPELVEYPETELESYSLITDLPGWNDGWTTIYLDFVKQYQQNLFINYVAQFEPSLYRGVVTVVQENTTSKFGFGGDLGQFFSVYPNILATVMHDELFKAAWDQACLSIGVLKITETGIPEYRTAKSLPGVEQWGVTCLEFLKQLSSLNFTTPIIPHICSHTKSGRFLSCEPDTETYPEPSPLTEPPELCDAFHAIMVSKPF